MKFEAKQRLPIVYFGYQGLTGTVNRRQPNLLVHMASCLWKNKKKCLIIGLLKGRNAFQSKDSFGLNSISR